MIPPTGFCGQIILDISVLCKIGRKVSFFKFRNVIENHIFEGDEKKLVELMHQISEANLCKIQSCGSDSAYTKSMKNKGFMIKFSTRMK